MKFHFKRIAAFVLAFIMMTSISSMSFAATTSEKLTKLVELSVIKGDANGVNGDQTMERYRSVVMMLRMKGLEDDMLAYNYVGKSNFTDIAGKSEYVVRLMAYMKANPQLGVVGYPDGSFKPLATISSKEHVKIMLEVLGYKQGVDFTWDNVSTQAMTLGVATSTVAVDSDTNFTVSDLADFTYNTLSVNAKGATQSLGEDLGYVVVVTAPIDIKTVTMTKVNEITVTFNKPVTATSPVLNVKKGAALYPSTTVWNAAKDTAVIKTTVDLPAADYTVVASGILATDITKNLTVAAEVASSIEIVGSTIDDATAAATIEFVVKNQYGEDMEIKDSAVVASVFNSTQLKAVTLLANDADKYLEVNTAAVADDFKIGDVLRITVSYNGITTQGNVTVANPAVAGSLQFGSLVLGQNDTRLNVADGTVKMTYQLFDQYSKAYTFNTAAAVAMPTTVQGVQFISSNSAVISEVAVVKVDDVSYLQFTVAGDGTAIITAVIPATGAVTTTTIVVNKDAAVKSVAIASPTMLVASQDKAFDLPLTITDQYGDIVKTTAGITATMVDNGTIDNNAVLTLTHANDTPKLNVDLSGLANGDVDTTKSITINLTSGGVTVGSISFNVEPEAEALSVKSTSFPTIYELGATYTVLAKDLVVVDQYGRPFEGTISIASATPATMTVGGDNVSLTAAGVGTSKLTVTVDGKTLDVNISVIASASIKGYTIASIGTLYVAVANYDKTVELYGVDANGKSVKLASTDPDFVTTSNASMVKVLADGITLQGVDAGSATIKAWVDGVAVATASVTASKEAPYAVSVEFTASLVDDAVPASDNVKEIVKVLDQYGVDITATTAMFFAGGTEIATTGVATDADNAVDEVETITVITSNGLSATKDITIN